ncbi:F-box DNA helicase 1 isoform X2 [Narcine bancroftii]|uniref:F-box DNA helicase 1 isoform X2 n=1 Tax=Narcine bancroftii TaxID=1343680 RepID=UPI003832064C
MHRGRRGKRKRLDLSDCLSLSNSRAGALSLTQPFSTLDTARDLNRGLYPRDKRMSKQLWLLQRQQVGIANRLSEDTSSSETVGQPCSGVDFVFDPADFLSTELSIERDVLFTNSNSNREQPILSPGCSTKNDSVEWDYATRSLENVSVTYQPNNVSNKLISAELEVDPLPDIYFGLLGCPGSHALPCGHISQLPDEILRAVFCHLPSVDLYRFQLVCQRWRRVLSDPMFVPWKKLYYRYRKGEGSAVMEVVKILKENKITKDDELCVLNLVRYVSSFQHGRSVNTEAVLNCLQNHPLFTPSKLCMSQILSDVIGAARTTSSWAIQAVIILLSNSVEDIQKLISCLGPPRSTLPLTELMEILYCMATLLFALREKNIIFNNRIHYNLYYVLYLRENPTTACRKQLKNLGSPQDSDRLVRNNMDTSPELEWMLNHEVVPDYAITVVGFAGTGKTSLLIEYAWRRPHLRFLYVLSTKPVPEETGYLFPPNVECTSMRHKAYQCIGYKYHQKRKLLIYGLKPFAAVRFPEAQGSLSRANLICQCLGAFFSSKDKSITVAHIPRDCRSTYGDSRSTYGDSRPLEQHEKLELVEDAKRIWEKMVDLHETSYFMTHDGYLKLWQLNKPSLSEFDVIFLDEAEDCSPVIMDIIFSQKCGKIIVGDPHQRISSFKGTFEAQHPHLISLTQTFRFGPEIAYIATTILDVFKKVQDKALVGGKQDGSTIDSSVGQVAFLCRTTATAFDEAARIVTSNNPCKIYFIGGCDTLGMTTLLDILVLMILEMEQATKDLVIQDPFIRIFQRKGGLRGLKNYAVQVEDLELEEKIAVVEKYSLEIPALVEKITSHCVTSPTSANFVLGTVHKAKGLEFDTVQIADDLVKVPGFRRNPYLLSGFGIRIFSKA